MLTGAPADEELGPLSDAFQRLQPALVRRLTLIAGDVEEARDLVQRAFLKATEQRQRLAADGYAQVDLDRWIAVVAVRLAIDERRRRRRWGFFRIREEDATWAIATDPDLWTALRTLDRNKRAALILTVLDGYSQNEVAEMLGVARGTVASWLARAREQLRQVLEEER